MLDTPLKHPHRSTSPYSGTFQPIATLTSNNSAPINYVIPYTGILSNASTPLNFSYGLGLVGY